MAKLDAYKKKRDFKKTPEPVGKKPKGKAKHPRFVVQMHSARALHYDFRLEVGGALVSWAVPKGPSMNPKDKRLAMRTEDHPIDYLDFEGVIPEGEYGAGPVIVWDRGVYANLTEKDGREISARKAIENGHINVLLRGEKMIGMWALTRTGGGEADGEREKWLLVKKRDEYADTRVKLTKKDKSVLSGKTIKQVKKDPERTWSSNR